MPGKRSHYRRSLSLTCPHCAQRVYRLNSPRYFTYLDEPTAIASALKLSKSQATDLANRGPVVNRNCWLEEFFCIDHGRLWLQLQREPRTNSLIVSLPDRDVWKRTCGTALPGNRNPSISEFSLRLSRCASPALVQRP